MLNRSKTDKLKDIGLRRQMTSYVGYYNISHFHEGKYDSDFVSPYSKSAGNADSKLVILLQDWSSFEGLSRGFNQAAAELGYDPRLQTNKNLKLLLNRVFKLEIGDVFVTNAFPFIKKGSMSANIPTRDIDRAFAEFCFPQIEIIAPRLIVCCGSKVYASALRFFGKCRKVQYLVNESFSYGDMIFCHQRHPGAIATNTTGGINVVIVNWQIMRDKYYL